MLERLKDDIQSCVDCDRVYSPDADAKRQLIGKAILAQLSVIDISPYLCLAQRCACLCELIVWLYMQNDVALSVKPCSLSLIINTVIADSCVCEVDLLGNPLA